MESESVVIPEWAQVLADDFSSKGHSVSYLAKIEKNASGIIALLGFADELRPEAPAVFGAWCAFVWAAKSGQFRDVEDIKHRVLEN